MKKSKVENVPIGMFGKDHWSAFAYIETRVVDHNGDIDIRHMRCHPGRHPQYIHLTNDKTVYPTRLKGYFDDPENPELFIYDHDDWDCLDDCEAAGLIEMIGTGIRPAYKLTDFGSMISGKLRKHKANGGHFATFDHTV